MKLSILISGAIGTLMVSIPTYAVRNGESVEDFSNYKSYAQLRSNDYNDSFCGASIYTDTLIITAAHCLFDKVSDEVRVDPNDVFSDIVEYAVYKQKETSDFSVVVKNPTSNDVDRSELKAVKAFYVHPDFEQKYTSATADQNFYDIALIELGTPIKAGDNVASINLPSASDVSEYNSLPHELDLIGLGNEFYQQKPEKLKQSLVDVNDDHYCFMVKNIDHSLYESVICTERVSESGDSGGPLYHTNSNGIQVQVGIVNASGVYSTFTELHYYINWINDVINNEGFVQGNSLTFDPSVPDENGYHSNGDSVYTPDNDNETPDNGDGGSSSGGGSGGSTGLLSLLGLGLLGFRRKR